MWPKPVSRCRKQSYCDQLWPWGGEVQIKRLLHQSQDVKHSRRRWSRGQHLPQDFPPPPLYTDEKPTDGGRPLLFSLAAAVPNGRSGSTQRLMRMRRWGSRGPRCSLFHAPWAFSWVLLLFYHNNSLSTGFPFCSHIVHNLALRLLIKSSIMFSQ